MTEPRDIVDRSSARALFGERPPALLHGGGGEDRLRVLRVSSVFEPPAASLGAGRGSGRAHAHTDPIGGMQNHTGSLTRALDRLGVSQCVVTTRLDGAAAEEPFGLHATVFRVGTPLRCPRRLYCVPASRLIPALAHDADLVHVHVGEDLAALPLAVAAARRRRLPLVVTIHCSLEHTLRAIDARTALLRILGGPVERWGEHHADAIITLTERLRSRLLAGGVDPQKVHVIPSGVEPGVFSAVAPRPFPELAGPQIVFVGRLAAAKGVHTLVAALAFLRSRNAHLVLVGDGTERPALEREIAERGLSERVRITGFIPHEEVPAQLAHADVLVLPSLYEEMGSILIEAMEAGVPVVASDTGGIGEVVRGGENGILVRPGAVEELAGAVDRVLTDPALAERLRAAGRARARSYHWDALGARVLDLYERVRSRVPEEGQMALPGIRHPF